MTDTATLWPTVAVVVLLAAVVSSGAGYAIDTPRDASVLTAPDVTATLSFAGIDPIDSGREREAPIVTLTNRFPVALTDVTVTVTDPTRAVPRLVSYTSPESLQPGESAAVLADVVCASGASEDWPVTVTATGGGVSVAFSRSVTVSCVSEGPGSSTGPGPADTDTETEAGTATQGEPPTPTAAAPGETTSTATPTSTTSTENEELEGEGPTENGTATPRSAVGEVSA